MKKKRIFIISILIAAIGLSGLFYYYHISVKVDNKRYIQLSEKQKLEDFDYAYDILRDNFPYFEIEKKKAGFDWLAHKKEFEDEIKHTKNDIEFYIKMEEIFCLVQSGHTGIISTSSYPDIAAAFSDDPVWNNILNNSMVEEKYKYWTKLAKSKLDIYYIPIVYAYVEGKYVIGDNSYGIPDGSILSKVNNMDIDKYIQGLVNSLCLSYDYKRNKLYIEQLNILCKKNEEVLFTFETPDGKEINKRLKTQLYNPYSNNSGINDIVQTRILDKNKTAYIKINSMANNYTDYYPKMLDFYKEIKDYPNLIIDIRGNGGGSCSFWLNDVVAPLESSQLISNNYVLFRNGNYIKPFIEERVGNNILPISSMPFSNKFKNNFIDFTTCTYSVPPKDTVSFKGRIYLLVDRKVFSSSEGFAAFAKSTKFATLIGTTTGGDGIGFDPAVAKLPNSNLIFLFPHSYGLNPDGTANEETHTQPDIYAEETYSDFLKSTEWMKTNNSDSVNPYDTVLNKTMEIIKAAK